MKIRTRLIAATLTAALLPGLTVTLAASAASTESASIGSWLAGELDGGLASTQWGPDHGLSVDVFVALHELGVEPGAASSVISALAADPKAYVTGEAFGDEGSTYAGSTGKLATAVELAGRDARDVGGDDLVARLEATIVTEGTETGRAKDVSAWGDYSNLIGQSWAVRALALSGSELVDEATAYLLDQQCSNGSFRLTMGAADCDPHLDATTFALEALVDARAAGVGGLGDDIADAADALVAAQESDGSLLDMGVANANTTGRAAWALRLVGRDSAADRATAWVRAVLVTSGPEKGAIAYDPAAFAAGKDGIDENLRDQWLRATAQGALAFVGATAPDPDPDPTPTPTPTTEPTPSSPSPTPEPTDDPGVEIVVDARVTAGETFLVRASGFTAGETVTADLSAGDAPAGTSASAWFLAVVDTATAAADGSVSVTATAPTTPGTYTLTMTSASVSGATSIEVVAPATAETNSGLLPTTGVGVGAAWLAAGLALLAVGAGTVLVARRRSV